MSDQTITVTIRDDAPVGTQIEKAVRSMAEPAGPVFKSDADYKESLRSLVAGSAVVKGKAKPLRGGMAIAAKAAESEQMQDLVSGAPSAGPAGEVQAALRGNGSDYSVPSVSASDIGAIGSGVSPQYLAKMEAALRDPKATPDEKQSAGEVVTKARLTAGVLGMAPVAKSAPDVSKLIKRLEDCMAQPGLKESTRAECGELISFHRLRQGALTGEALKATSLMTAGTNADNERLASNAEVRAAQTRPGISGGADAQAQIRSICGDGQPMSLGQVQNLGNRGDFTGSNIGKVEPDPAVVAAQLEDELVKSTDPRRRAEAGECLTYMRLAGLVAA